MWMAVQGQKTRQPRLQAGAVDPGLLTLGGCRPRYQPTRQCVKKVVLIDENRTGDRLRC